MSLSIGIQLTTRCNLTCTHCFLDGSVNDLSMETLKNIISYAKANGCTCLSLTGGEPALHPRFAEIVGALAGNNITFTMITNGQNFTDTYQRIPLIAETLHSVDFSLDGATEEIHDLNRGNGTFRNVLRAVSMCSYKSIPFGIRMTVTRRNIEQLEEMALLAAKLGARELFILPLQPTPGTASLNFLPGPRDLDMIQEQVLRLRKIFRMKITLTAGYYSRDLLFVCPTLINDDLFVASSDEVSFCCHLTNYAGGIKGTEMIADLKKTGLREAHQLVKKAITGYKQNKTKDHKSGLLQRADYYPCWYCLKHFRKVDWMAEYPDNPWSADMLRQKSGREDEQETRQQTMIPEICK